MKIIQKYLSVLAFTIFLFCIAVYIAPAPERILPQFTVQNPDGSAPQSVSIYDANDGNYYVFLPSYADLNQVAVTRSQNQSYSLGEMPLTDGANCGSFQLETPYDFLEDDQKIATLWFYRSANVATMYIDTLSGNMKYLHQNKEHKETVSVALYTDQGELTFSDQRSSLNGRGNVSWEYDKRPYTLTLSADHGLLDMAPASKWVLLANAADETNLNNKLIFDLANRIGFQWTPQCRWIDLYTNGEYSGLYLLIEKIEVHENRLALDDASGAFLCRVDIDDRWASLQNPFSTHAGRTVEISYPGILGSNDLFRIESLVSQLEEEILSGSNLQESAILDLDSWVRRYLIDEISANIDSDLASSYFYYSDGTFFAGPLWDYDMTLGNHPRNRDPWAFIAKNRYKADYFHSVYYGALYENPAFYSRVRELYRTEFVPELQKMLNGEIDSLTEFIRLASRSNSLRWRQMYDSLSADVVHTPSALKDYFARRVSFLDSAWLDNTPYCTVQFKPSSGGAYRSVSVEKGQKLASGYVVTDSVIWIDSATNEVIDLSLPITRDLILSRQAS